jgi:hypothetical protein
MNLQTVANSAPKTAQNREPLIVFSSEESAENCDKKAFGRENSPRKTALCRDIGKPTNAQIIAELTRARCVFQLEAIRTVMGVQNDASCADISEQ